MLRFLAPLVAVSAALAAGPQYELSGRIVARGGGSPFGKAPPLNPASRRAVPRSSASVTIFAIDTPYEASTLADVTGYFLFKNLQPGLYTVAIYTRGRGEARRTVEVGPMLADRKHRVSVTLEFGDEDWVFRSSAHMISTSQLAVPERATNEYLEAQKELSHHDVAAAVRRLEHAVDLAPQFSAAWNNLGTIAYQTGNYTRAEECFREAVENDPQSYEALVNLGGVLVTLRKLDEAMQYNLQSVLARPNDPLANSQLGTTYYLLKEYDLAAKYLERTRELDPAHFSLPQVLLSEIYYQRGDRGAAANVLEDFLKNHPDWAEAEKMRKTIAGLRAPAAR